MRKASRHFKWGLVGHTSRSMEDGSAEGDLNCQDIAQEVSEENYSMWPREHSCGILVKKKVTAFCPCPKNMPDAKVKSYG